MNTSLYRSWHALVALLLIAGFVAWARAVDRPLGWALGADRGFLLWSGWVALALYLVLWAYAARKAAHRTRASFEFARAVPLARLERAQERLSDLRVDAFAGRITDPRTLLQRARRVLVEENVGKVLAVAVAPATGGQPARIEVAWRAPLGRLAKWMHTHIYYGFAAAALVTLHGGLRFSSTMGILLNALSIAVLATGFVGLKLWTFGPRWLSSAERDLNLERATALRAHYRAKVEALAAAPSGDAQARDLRTLKGQQRCVEAAWQRLAGRRFALDAWRLIHVPLSIALLLVVAVHVFSVWLY